MANRENQKERMDELAITKAAAWAWYERGSWFEHNSIRETDCRRSSDYTRRPTRYKLEAMNNVPNKSTHDAQPFTNGSLLCTEHLGNSLLDMYEIKRISKELDCYIGSSDVKHRRKSLDGGGYGGVVSFPEDRVGKRESKTKSKTMTKTEKRKGFWIGRPIVCGSTGDDVVNSSLLVGGRRRQKEHVDKVAGIINFRRSITHGIFR